MGIRDPKGTIHQWETEAGMGRQLSAHAPLCPVVALSQPSHASAPRCPSPPTRLDARPLCGPVATAALSPATNRLMHSFFRLPFTQLPLPVR